MKHAQAYLHSDGHWPALLVAQMLCVDVLHCTAHITTLPCPAVQVHPVDALCLEPWPRSPAIAVMTAAALPCPALQVFGEAPESLE